MEFLTNLVDWFLSFGYLGIGFIVALEYACFPLASEILLPLIGFFISQGKFTIVQTILVSVIGGVIGSLFLYTLGYYGGHPTIELIKRKFPKTDRNLTSAMQWFEQYGKISVLIARLLPMARTWISLIGGTARMRLSTFLAYSIIGIVFWNTLLIMAGYFLGENWHSVLTLVEEYKRIVIIGGGLAVCAVILLHFRHRLCKKG